MTGRERVLATLNGNVADRVPLDMHANPFVQARLHRELGTRSHVELLTRLGVDVVDLRGVVDPVYCGPRPAVRNLGNGIRENIWGWRQKVVEGAAGPEECFVDFALAEATSIEELAAHEWPSPDWFDFTGFAEDLRPWKDFAVMASGASVFQHPTFLRGMDTLLMDMALQPELAAYVMDRYTDFYVEYFDRMLTSAAGRIDILRIADDLGTQIGLVFGPDMFDTFIAPRLRRLVEMAHSHGAKVMLHSCGAIRPLIERIIAVGIDILDPLQALAAGMEPEGLVADFGGRIVLHGGICTQQLLPHGAPKAITAEVERRLDIHAGTPYILAPCHILQADVPTENILALAEAAQACCGSL